MSVRLTLRFKLFAVVAVATISLFVLTLSNARYERRVEDQLDSIHDRYLPKIRLRPQLQVGFGKIGGTIEAAVAASDHDLLASVDAQRDALLALIENAPDAVTAGQMAAARLAIDDYLTAAIEVSRRLIASEGGEDVTVQIQEMQAKRARAEALIDRITHFDETELTGAFTATKAAQQTATTMRLVISALCLGSLLALSIWIGVGMFRNLEQLVAGLERFGRHDFAKPITPTGRDELADVAAQANRMAEHLQRFDIERTRSEWIKNGLAGLNDELRGELDPAEVAQRTVAYLARYLEAPLGALYHGPVGGPFALIGGYALADGTAPGLFALGEGLVGQAATRPTITVIESPDGGGLPLRSGLVDTPPRTLVLLPLARAEAVTGVLELATVRPWREHDSELLSLASETIAITLEVARARSSSRALLEQTRRQAEEIERARASIEQKASELAKASSYKSQFLASMSHELRTPLNAIIGFSEILHDGAIPLDDETAKEYLGDILTSGRHLLQLINDVLDLSKVEAGKLEFYPERISLTTVVNEILTVLRSTSAKQQIRIEVDIAPAVDELVLDPARLKQVLYNYLSNALKFTPPHGRVIVRARPEGDDRVKLEVEDTGVGIAADDVARLFADFQQAADGARKTGGTGLGLSLTKRLVETQGGEVGVRSVVGTGSTFYAILPRHSTGTTLRTLVAAPVTTPPSGAATVLVIEDDPADRDQIVLELTAMGYAVEAVGTGAEAIARCHTRTYDAITLDLFLPDMTGLEALQRLREGPNENAPVVVVTIVAERGAVAGFAVHDVLSKPLSGEALRTSLQRAGVLPVGPDARESVVLVVDDDPASLKVMAATLRQLGYTAVCEQEPERGLRLATEKRPAAIVLDLIMPGMTGFEFLERFRTTPLSREVPVIVWTSKDLTSEELARLRRSARAVISKGADGNARVLAEIASFLPSRSARGA